MNEIKPDKIQIKYFGIFFIIVIIYICLVSADWCLKVYLNMNKFEPNKKAIQIEQKFRKTIPTKAKKKRDEGFKPMFFPSYFNKTKEYNYLYKKYSNLPLGVLPNTKYYVCDEGYGLTTFKSDKFGFWNPNKIYNKKIDLMIIGDSLSMNGCLQEENSFIGMLRKDFNVMNLSIGSNDPIHYAATAEIFIPEFKPRIVLMIFNRGDFIDHFSQKIHIYKKNFLMDKNSYFDKKKSLNNYPENYEKNLLNLLNEAQTLTEENIGNFENLTPVKKPSLVKRITILISSHYKLTYIRNVLLKESYLPSGNYLALSTLDNKCKIIDCKGFYAFVPGSDFWRPDSRQDKYVQLLFSASYKFDDLEFINFSETIISSDLKFYSPKGNHLSKSANKKIYIKLINSLDKIN